ncbi:tetratricopeptide repeat protein [Nannocystis radixulma]|uniref:Tetratricopeptide repeat protein n=1 Tax=Nannocystis radixulma TaxID=2995305 RepID=A0ABT5B1Q5_9BACT|nr:tetratricopeptide repeat protein [Nannocystis radixulma]MDC0668007.1 hypothetical protein [Nannocystis radixulma]
MTTALGDVTAARAVFAIGRDHAGLHLAPRAGEAELHTTAKQPADPATELAPPAVPREAIASPEELLREAQARLGDGEAARAIAAYETLLRHHPRSVEAQAARISLGNLLLVRNQPARALRAFDRYLGGDLAEEALYGKIGALRRLGRAREVEAASAEFLARYPDSLYAPKLRAQRGQ